MRYFLIITVSLLVIGCGNDIGRYQNWNGADINKGSYDIIDTKTGRIYSYDPLMDNWLVMSPEIGVPLGLERKPFNKDTDD